MLLYWKKENAKVKTVFIFFVPQIRAAMDYCCITDVCEPSELFSMLQEMDRRYFLLKDFRWEFSILDRNQQDFITEDQAR